MLKELAGRANPGLGRLHGHRALVVFERSRPRVYRVMDPEGLVLVASGEIAGLERVGQERYHHILVASCLDVLDRCPDASMALYGSVARGSANELSDLDLLIVSGGFKGSLAARKDRRGVIERPTRREPDHALLSGHQQVSGIWALWRLQTVFCRRPNHQ